MVGMEGIEPPCSRPRDERSTNDPHPDWSGWRESNPHAPAPKAGGQPLTHTQVAESRGLDPQSLSRSLRLATEPGPWPVYSPWRKAGESNTMPRGTHRFRGGLGTAADLPSFGGSRRSRTATAFAIPPLSRRGWHRCQLSFQWRKAEESNPNAVRPSVFKAAATSAGRVAFLGVPTGSRTPVCWLRTSCPRPLDDRDMAPHDGIEPTSTLIDNQPSTQRTHEAWTRTAVAARILALALKPAPTS